MVTCNVFWIHYNYQLLHLFCHFTTFNMISGDSYKDVKITLFCKTVMFNACLFWERVIIMPSSNSPSLQKSLECINVIELPVILALYIFLHCTVCIKSLPVALTQIICLNFIRADTTEGICSMFIEVYAWYSQKEHLQKNSSSWTVQPIITFEFDIKMLKASLMSNPGCLDV